MADAVGFGTPGAANNGADKLALFLKVFSGEVLSTFERMNKVRSRVRRRVITSGKVAQFPAIGKVTASYHSRGVNIISPDSGTLLSNVEHGEQLIHIDRRLIAPVLLDELDDLMNHYELRSEYSTEIGRALAETDDRQLLQVACLAARATSGPTSDHPIGKVLRQADMDSTIATLSKGVRVAAELLDNNDVPESDRTLYLRPQQYRMIVEDGTLIDKDIGGSGSLAAGTVNSLIGFLIVKSNNIPSTDVTSVSNQHTGTTVQNDYRGDFQNTVGIAMHKSAIGTVQLMGVRTSVTWKEEYQAWLLLGKQAVGHGILRPGAAIELSKSTDGAEMTNDVLLSTLP
jgi:hypothetical protein